MALLAALCMAGPGQPLLRAQPGVPGKPQVYVGDSPAAQDLFEQAGSMRQQNRPLEAASLYQQIIEHYPDQLMETGGGVYTDAAPRGPGLGL